MLIELLQFCPLSIKNIKCNILAINLPWWSLKQIMEDLPIGLKLCILNWSKSWLDGKSVRKTWLKEQQKKAKKICMPFCYCPKSFVLEVVSTRRSKTTREEVDRTTIRGQEKKGNSKGEVYKKQTTCKPCTNFS